MDGITEHWIFLSGTPRQWKCYDPNMQRWLTLRTVPSTANVEQWESLVVGHQLLLFGDNMNVRGQTCLSYNFAAGNYWSRGPQFIRPRFRFAAASYQDTAIVAGGRDDQGEILSFAEQYLNGGWRALPNMNRRRVGCAGFFMDDKFYVIGGTDQDGRIITSGDEYELNQQTWTVIPSMSLRVGRQGGLPPLVAVINNELYTAIYPSKKLKKYNKGTRWWITLGEFARCGRII